MTGNKASQLSELPRPAKKDLGGPVWLVISTLLIFFITQLIASFIVAFFLVLMHPGENAADLLKNSIPGQFFYVLIAELLAVAAAIGIVRRQGLSRSFIGLGRRSRLSDLWRAAGGFVVFYALLIIVGVLIKVFLPDLNTNQQQQLGFNTINSTGDNILAFFALVILPPLGEEPLVRGYLFSGLRARWPYWPAAIITSLLFGLAHLEFGSGAPLLWAAGIDTFILSLVLVYLREKTGALYAGILVHTLNNLVAFIVTFH